MYIKGITEAMRNEDENKKEYNQDFSLKEVEDAIAKAKNNSAPGPDEITYEMLKWGKDIISPDMQQIYNRILKEEEEKPKDWCMGNIISIYKGKGNRQQMNFQRGISLTNCTLKCMEMMIGERIDPIIKKNSTPLQGGGKSGESVEEYLLALQTIIDMTIKKGKYANLIITDVAKAFDQAWRVGVFKNLSERGIKGRMLKLIWKINNDMSAKIKKGETTSEPLTVEESIRQGSVLSANIYAQHAATLIEDMEEKEMGIKIQDIFAPAIGWQDDITMIPQSEEETEQMTKAIEESARKNRIRFSDGEDKCKILRIGKVPPKTNEVKIGNIHLKEKTEAKVLGHHFCKENNNNVHLREKEKECRQMMASMGLSLNNAHMGRMYIQSMLTIYQKCFIPKILYGLAGFKTTKAELKQLELLNRTIIRNFLHLPQCTPIASLYLELGLIPIESELKKKKLMMWHRINRKESNNLIKNVKAVQVNEDLPWMKELVDIAHKLNIDLTEAKNVNKDKWKKKVDKKVLEEAQKFLIEEKERTRKYRENAIDEIKVKVSKGYLHLPTKIVEALFRGRTGLLDPEPTKPYWKNIWKCKLCRARDQSTNHYVRTCEGTRQFFQTEIEREEVWNVLRTLEPEGKIERTANILYCIFRYIQGTS